MAVLTLFLALFICVSNGKELAPFIAWSTDSISELDSSTTIHEVTNALEELSVATVVLFAYEQLSFDDIAKYGGAFGSSDGMSQLQSSVLKAPYQSWTGLSSLPKTWVSTLEKGLEMTPVYLKANELNSLDVSGGFYIVSLPSSNKFTENDAIVGQVMAAIQSSNSYLAISTVLHVEEPKEQPKSRKARNIQEDEPTTPTLLSGCPIGGLLNDANNTCMMFCLSSPLYYYIKQENETNNCTLVTPYLVNYNCSPSANGSFDNIMDDSLISRHYGKPYPSVSVYFTVYENATDDTNNTGNNCTLGIWKNYFNLTLKEGEKRQLDVILTFFFPSNDFLYNGKSGNDSWSVMISAVDVRRAVKPDAPPITSPPDEDIKSDEELVSDRVLFVRQNPSSLYRPILLDTKKSYACAAQSYNIFLSVNSSLNETTGVLNITNFLNGSNDTYFRQLNLSSFQVQPYEVSSNSFSVADNCVGYFNEVIWTGIISMGILIIIFYLAILCAFSVQTMDQLEDPRGPTISVERLH